MENASVSQLPFYKTRKFWLFIIVFQIMLNIFLLQSLFGDTLIHNLKATIMIIGGTPIALLAQVFIGNSSFSQNVAAVISLIVISLIFYKTFFHKSFSEKYAFALSFLLLLTLVALYFLFGGY